MSDEIREQLSALADDELSEVEQPLLLGRLERDPELRACLGRYQLIGEVMRGSGATATLGVADRVQQVLGEETTAGAENSHSVSDQSVWWKPLAGLAVAASVAMVAVFTVTSVNEESAGTVPVVASAPTAITPVSDPIDPVAVSDDGQWDRLDPEIDKRLSGYLVNHNEYAASRGMQGVMPYVRIVGHDTSE